MQTSHEAEVDENHIQNRKKSDFLGYCVGAGHLTLLSPNFFI